MQNEAELTGLALRMTKLWQRARYRDYNASFLEVAQAQDLVSAGSIADKVVPKV